MSTKTKKIIAFSVAGVLLVVAVLGGWWFLDGLYAKNTAAKFKSTAFTPEFEQIAPASLSAEINDSNLNPASVDSNNGKSPVFTLGINADSYATMDSEQTMPWNDLINEFENMHASLKQYKGWILESFTNSRVSGPNTWARLNHGGGGHGYYKYEKIDGNTAIYEQKVSKTTDKDGTTVYKGKLSIDTEGTTEMYVNSFTTYDANPEVPQIIRAYSKFSDNEFIYIAYWEHSPSDINVVYMNYQFDENGVRSGVCVDFIIDDGTYSSVETSLFWGDEVNLYFEHSTSDDEGPIHQFDKLEQKGTVPDIYTNGNFWDLFRIDIPALSTFEVNYASREEIAEVLKEYCLTFEIGFRD